MLRVDPKPQRRLSGVQTCSNKAPSMLHVRILLHLRTYPYINTCLNCGVLQKETLDLIRFGRRDDLLTEKTQKNEEGHWGKITWGNITQVEQPITDETHDGDHRKTRQWNFKNKTGSRYKDTATLQEKQPLASTASSKEDKVGNVCMLLFMFPSSLLVEPAGSNCWCSVSKGLCRVFKLQQHRQTFQNIFFLKTHVEAVRLISNPRRVGATLSSWKWSLKGGRDTVSHWKSETMTETEMQTGDSLLHKSLFMNEANLQVKTPRSSDTKQKHKLPPVWKKKQKKKPSCLWTCGPMMSAVPLSGILWTFTTLCLLSPIQAADNKSCQDVI